MTNNAAEGSEECTGLFQAAGFMPTEKKRAEQ